MGGYRRTPQQDPIFAAHGIPGKIDRSQVTFETVVSWRGRSSAAGLRHTPGASRRRRMRGPNDRGAAAAIARAPAPAIGETP